MFRIKPLYKFIVWILVVITIVYVALWNYNNPDESFLYSMNITVTKKSSGEKLHISYEFVCEKTYGAVLGGGYSRTITVAPRIYGQLFNDGSGVGIKTPAICAEEYEVLANYQSGAMVPLIVYIPPPSQNTAIIAHLTKDSYTQEASMIDLPVVSISVKENKFWTPSKNEIEGNFPNNTFLPDGAPIVCRFAYEVPFLDDEAPAYLTEHLLDISTDTKKAIGSAMVPIYTTARYKYFSRADWNYVSDNNDLNSSNNSVFPISVVYNNASIEISIDALSGRDNELGYCFKNQDGQQTVNMTKIFQMNGKPLGVINDDNSQLDTWRIVPSSGKFSYPLKIFL